MVGTIVKVLSAVAARPAEGALALIVGAVVDTSCSVLTRIELLGAEGNLSLTKLSCVTSWTCARVGVQAINTGGTIDTLVVGTVINVDFTATSLKTRGTVAPGEHKFVYLISILYLKVKVNY